MHYIEFVLRTEVLLYESPEKLWLVVVIAHVACFVVSSQRQELNCD